MALIPECDSELIRDWLATRPPAIQEMARRTPMDRLHRIKATGQRVYVAAYCEDGSLTVCVSGRFNLVDFEREVFGLRPEDLEECDLPAAEEPLGAIARTQPEVDAAIERERARRGL